MELTQSKLMEMVAEAKKMMKESGFELPTIKYEISNTKNRLGDASKYASGLYRIRISKVVANLRDERETQQTILHEMIHTLPNCMNHGEEWKSIATIINRRYGFEISRTTAVEDLAKQSAKYKIYCEDCGKAYYRTRKSEIVKHPNHYNCGICRGRLKVEILK